MPLSRPAALALFALAASACLGCDQLTKAVARARLEPYSPVHLAAETLSLTLVENHGAFLSLGSALPEWFRFAVLGVGVPVILAVVCLTFLRRRDTVPIELLGLALVAGGGAGNWLDRMLQDGAVTDFLRLSLGPLHTGIFNVADVAIVAGVALLASRAWIARPAP